MRSSDALGLAVELGALLETAGLPYAMGADDERVRAWDDIVRRSSPLTP